MQVNQAGQDIGGGAVRQERHGEVLVLVIDSPPVNAVSQAVREGLAAGLDAAADPGIAAVVIRGAGKGFSAGADINEFGQRRQSLGLAALCDRVDAFPKPVIAALHGVALGGGLEIALAAHYRIAEPGAHLGLPEVNLGLLPGAGGTQRLPRLIGAVEALRLLLSGAPVSAAEALALGLIDAVTPGDPGEAALALARSGPEPRPAESRRVRDGFGLPQAIAAARVRLKGHRLPAPARIVDCVEAACLLPLAQGLAFERVAFEDVVDTPEAAGLRHAFLAERRAIRPPQGVVEAGNPPLAVIGLWGLGASAAETVQQALAAGLRVVLALPERASLVAALEAIAAVQGRLVAEGTLSPEARDADWARLAPAVVPGALSEADLVLAAPDAPPLPAGIVSVAVLGPVQAGYGLGLTAPASAGGLSEISLVPGVAPAQAARALALARRLDWRPVFTGPGGPIDRRLRLALSAAVAELEAEGTTRAELTAALAAFGLGTGARSHLPPMPPEGGRLVAACLAAMAAEGARMLETGLARRPLDIDAVSLATGLLPRWEGGPMFWADRRGLLLLRADLRARADRAAIFAPALLFDRLIAEGRNLASLNAG